MIRKKLGNLWCLQKHAEQPKKAKARWRQTDPTVTRGHMGRPDATGSRAAHLPHSMEAVFSVMRTDSQMTLVIKQLKPSPTVFAQVSHDLSASHFYVTYQTPHCLPRSPGKTREGSSFSQTLLCWFHHPGKTKLCCNTQCFINTIVHRAFLLTHWHNIHDKVNNLSVPNT